MASTILNDLLTPLKRYSRLFNNRTKIINFRAVQPQAKKPALDKWGRVSYKAYPRFSQFLLPIPSVQKHEMFDALFKRESCRDFANSSLLQSQFSQLLYFTLGEKKLISGDNSTKRFYPSAGARYPLEAYAFVFNVEGINNAAYHYHIKTHSLELILEKSSARRVFMQFDQEWINNSAVLLVFTAVYNRTEEKYGDRGYRHILTEYGHVAQNMYLLSAALDVGCCSVGGFIDDGLNALLDIDGINEGVVGAIALGAKK